MGYLQCEGERVICTRACDEKVQKIKEKPLPAPESPSPGARDILGNCSESRHVDPPVRI